MATLARREPAAEATPGAKAGGASLVWFPIRDAGGVSGSASGSGTGATIGG